MPHWAVSMIAYVATAFQLTSFAAEREIANQKHLGKPWLPLCLYNSIAMDSQVELRSNAYGTDKNLFHLLIKHSMWISI